MRKSLAISILIECRPSQLATVREIKYIVGAGVTVANAGKIISLFLIVPRFVRKYRFVTGDVAYRRAVREFGRSCE